MAFKQIHFIHVLIGLNHLFPVIFSCSTLFLSVSHIISLWAGTVDCDAYCLSSNYVQSVITQKTLDFGFPRGRAWPTTASGFPQRNFLPFHTKNPAHLKSFCTTKWGCFSFPLQGGMCCSSLECGLVHYLRVWGSTELPSQSPGALHSSADSWSQHRSGEQPPRGPAKHWKLKAVFKCLCWQHTTSSPTADTTKVQDHAQLKEKWTERFEFYGDERKYPYSVI